VGERRSTRSDPITNERYEMRRSGKRKRKRGKAETETDL